MTHSQTLDKLFIGIENLRVVVLNTFFDPRILLERAFSQEHPVLVVENKLDYSKKVGAGAPQNFVAEVSNDEFPFVRIRPELSAPTVTIVSYGGLATEVRDILRELFVQHEIKGELIIVSCINPIDIGPILDSVSGTRKLVVVEEGGKVGGFGSELVASLVEVISVPVQTHRIGAVGVPIPSARHLEDLVLPTADRILSEIAGAFKDETI